MSMEIVPLAAVPEQDQEAFLASRAEATFFHSPRYRRFLLEMLGCADLGWAAMRDGEMLGMLPAMAQAGPQGLVINSLPFFGSHGGVVGGDAKARTALWQVWRERVGMEDVAAATVVGNPFDPDSLDLPTGPGDLRDERISQVTPLPGDDARDMREAILALVDGSARRNVAKAEREGVTIAVENDALPFLEQAHRAGMEAIGGRPKPANFFTLLPRIFRPGIDYRLYVARLDGAPVAALLLFYYGTMVEYFIPATTPDLRQVQPMGALLLHAMAEAASLGYRQWNWGGTWTSQDGVYRFKKKWGAEEKRYQYLVTIRANELLDASPADLAARYPWFYVAPYAALRKRAAP